MQIHTVTWNLGTRIPSKSNAETLELQHLLPSLPVDIIAIGFQELFSQTHALSLPALELFTTLPSTRPSSVLLKWVELIQNTLDSMQGGLRSRYKLYFAKRLVAIGLCVFINTDSFHEHSAPGRYTIQEARTGHCGVGLGGVYGNKGLVALQLDIVDHEQDHKHMSICLASAHLQAHEGPSYFLARNEDMFQMLDCLLLLPLSSLKSLYFYSHPIQWSCEFIWPGFKVFSTVCKLLNDTSHELILMGDLNYRFQKPSHLTSFRSCLLSLIQQSDYSKMMELDELYSLLHSRSNLRNPFDGFQEHSIAFPPTYKYKLKSRDYSSKRCPAYCDRILYRPSSSSHVHAIEYTSVDAVTGWSDHQPVKGLYEIRSQLVHVDAAPMAASLSVVEARRRMWWVRSRRFTFHTIIPCLLVLTLLYNLSYAYYAIIN